MKRLILTEQEQEFVRNNYRDLTYVQLGKAVGMTKAQIVDQVKAMGLSKEVFLDDQVPVLGEWFDWEEFSKTDNCYFNTRIRKAS